MKNTKSVKVLALKPYIDSSIWWAVLALILCSCAHAESLTSSAYESSLQKKQECLTSIKEDTAILADGLLRNIEPLRDNKPPEEMRKKALLTLTAQDIAAIIPSTSRPCLGAPATCNMLSPVTKNKTASTVRPVDR